MRSQIADRRYRHLRVIDAAATKPFGFTPYPGPGIGGHCIPSIRSISLEGAQYGLNTHFIELAGGERGYAHMGVNKITAALNDREKSLRATGWRWGIAYKRDVDDMRGMPSMIMMKFTARSRHDRWYADLNVRSFRNAWYRFDQSRLFDAEKIASMTVALLTSHSSFDYERI